MGLPRGHDHDVHPSSLLLRATTLAPGARNPRPYLDCSEAHPYEQLPIPASTVRFRTLQGQRLASAGALITAVRYVLRATVVPPAGSYVSGPSYFHRRTGAQMRPLRDILVLPVLTVWRCFGNVLELFCYLPGVDFVKSCRSRLSIPF